MDPFVAATLVAPAALGAINTANVMGMTHGKRLSNWWWNRLYRSRRCQIMASDTDQLQYFLILINLAIRMEEKDYDTNRRRVTIPNHIMYILLDDNYKHRDLFFTASGKRQRNWIYMPLKPFLITSDPIANKYDHFATTQILVCPVTDGLNVYGFELWTYQWFWGGVSKYALNPAEACKAMERTCQSMQEYTGIEEKLRIVKMAQNNLPVITEQDKQLVKDYTIAYHKIIDPEFKPFTAPPPGQQASSSQTPPIMQPASSQFVRPAQSNPMPIPGRDQVAALVAQEQRDLEGSLLATSVDVKFPSVPTTSIPNTPLTTPHCIAH